MYVCMCVCLCALSYMLGLVRMLLYTWLRMNVWREASHICKHINRAHIQVATLSTRSREHEVQKHLAFSFPLNLVFASRHSQLLLHAATTSYLCFISAEGPQTIGL